MVGADGGGVPVTRQCAALGVARSSAYFKPKGISMAKAAFDEKVMASIDHWHMERPALGSRQLAKIIRREDKLPVGRKLIQRLM